ncbi:DNA-binding protein RFX2-like isoform X2 [Limulus polyphemus]|uniref:DNA-binding protein RFX2-like isoform X2 n=1 Tax=Limulus polyphemus TaxID=6850 RepID=A0ABM1SK93_LIMPO|nr:DNA-binding protein RFX2-like isoform X2 [Limulus polyphemus]
MTTQNFLSDMQVLTVKRVQVSAPTNQHQSQSSGQVVQSSQAQASNQTSAQTVVSVAPGQQQQSSQGSRATVTVAVPASVSVVAPPSQQQPQDQQPQTQQQTSSVVVQASSNSGTPQFIAVADGQGQGTVALQATQPTFVQYVDGGGDPGMYGGTNASMTGYPVYSVTDSSTMYSPATAAAAYYNTGTAVTYSQVGSTVSANAVGIQGQLLAHQTGGTYLVQHTAIDSDGNPLAHATRASPATVHILEDNGGFKVQGALLEGETHQTLKTASSSATCISPVTEDCQKITEVMPSFSNDQCVIQTLHSSPDNNQLQLQPQQPQSQPLSTHHSQQQSVRDMDIIHVQWLIDNYETAEGVSLPRSTLYNHYLQHCTEHKLEPVNAASFGKLIRSVFLGLRTRRLGTRGNSKYHYYGIRVKPNSPLNQISEDSNSSALRQQPVNPAKRFKSNTFKSENLEGSRGSCVTNVSSHSTDGISSQQQQPAPHQHQHQQYLGDASAAIPNLDLETSSLRLPDDIEIEDVHAFKVLYKEHCEAFLDAVITLQFSMIETLWRTFWRTQSNGQSNDENTLKESSLYKLCLCEEVQKLVRNVDYQFYQNLVDVLIPDVLRPIPSSLTQAIRNFAKSLEGWLTSAMAGCPDDMVRVKVSAVSAFAQTLRRYTSLNHLAQAARAVLQNSSQINQMLSDLNRVDFHNVQEQASWVCQCEDEMVQRIEQDFKVTLQQQNSLEQWAAWLEGVVNLVLQPFKEKPDFPKAARQFLLKWSFYSSMVIRDLTLRSAASFGSFHLIRLLYDEYMFYLIEHKVAKTTGETPISVMGEFIGLGVKLGMTSKLPALHRNSTDARENGSSEDITSIDILPHSSSSSCSTGAYSNGLKDSTSGLTSFQQGLIGQSHLDSDILSEAP